MDLGQLLTQITGINQKYEEIYKHTGEKFNIFNLLDLTEDELSHSKILESLLNPKGMHGKGNRFLELFLKCIGINDFSIDKIKTEAEYFIGNISKDYQTGGRIDIVITNENNKKQQIFIENKINAIDQPNQLIRYHNYNQDAKLIYLTLNGDDPSEDSIGKNNDKLNQRINKISYKKDILEWIELCRLEAINNPLLRETLTQYIILIKQITGQARSKKMIEEYKDIIVRNPENIEAAYSLYRNFIDIRKLIFEKDIIPAFENIAKAHGYTFNKSTKYKFLEKHWCCYLQKENWGNRKIGFTFKDDTLRGIIYWIHRENIDPDFEKYVLANYGEDKGYKNNSNYILYKYAEDKYKNWYLDFVKEWYKDNAEIIKYFKGIVKDLTEIVESKDYKL